MLTILAWAKRAGVAILGSKKATAAAGAVLFILCKPLANKWGWAINEAQILELLGIASAYILGQGIADLGKEAKLLEGKKK